MYKNRIHSAKFWSTTSFVLTLNAYYLLAIYKSSLKIVKTCNYVLANKIQ